MSDKILKALQKWCETNLELVYDPKASLISQSSSFQKMYDLIRGLCDEYDEIDYDEGYSDGESDGYQQGVYTQKMKADGVQDREI